MGWKIFFSLLFFLIVVGLLAIYWFIPLDESEFIISSGSFSFVEDNQVAEESTQFYPNMRFSDNEISYRIYDCPLNKKNNMEQAFSIISDETEIDFYPAIFENKEEVSVYCQSENRIEEGLFIAGEGGPTNITKTSNFNVILEGRILLIRPSKCETPNIELHELLHVLGFDHVNDDRDLMYPVSKCGQIINPSAISLLNELYSVPSKQDLAIENASAVMRGKYLDAEVGIRNNGLKASKSSKILIYVDDSLLKEISVEPLDIGYGKIVSIRNLWIAKLSVSEIRFVIQQTSDELDESNNVVALKIKK